MPKKNQTEAEKKAWGLKMKLAREAAKVQKQEVTEAPNDDYVIDDNQSYENLELRDTVETLTRQVQELLNAQRLEKAVEVKQETPSLGQMGNLVGSFERYITDPKFYPDPRERLANEPRLARFAFNLNYELSFAVSTTQYETIDNRRVKEPRFTLELIRIMLDEDGEQTNRRFVVTRGIFHEDPEAAIEIAGRNNVRVDESNQKTFLDEMRYLRMRDWLLEAFYPPKADAKQNKHQEVIGNKLVDVYTKSNEVGTESAPIPFDSMHKF